MPYKDPEKEREKKTQYYKRMKSNPLFIQHKREAYKRWYQTHKAEAYTKHRQWDKQNKLRRKELAHNGNARLKYEVLLHYTESRFAPQNPYCNKCGFSDIRALSLDLIKGGHSSSGLPSGGSPLYRKLKKEGYPEGWQVLCMNCQWIKRWTNKELH